MFLSDDILDIDKIGGTGLTHLSHPKFVVSKNSSITMTTVAIVRE